LAKRSITQRWIVNNLGVVLAILIAVEVGFAVSIQNYYYSSARQYLNSRMNMVSSLLNKYSQDLSINFSAEVRDLVESFSEKNRMELMAIDTDGRIAITSSGFSPESFVSMPDYDQARNSSSGQGFFMGVQENGEKVMALCVIISNPKSDYDAMRLVASLEQVDAQISQYIFAVSAACAAILLLVSFSGLYFIKSIVIPIRQIGTTAKSFAKGDFSVRLEKKKDDEIGELCDIINYMASELSNAEAMKNEFISSVSHELRTPLTAIKGWSETVAQMTDDPATIKKGMQVIGSETERLSQMVEELLDFSRMQNGRFSLNKETMDILAELEEAVLIYTEKAKHEGIEVIYNEPEMLPFVYGDRNRIRQVFINVIDNAIKYSEQGGIVSVEALCEKDKIKISVSDKGCGIPKEDLPKVKNKFYKANNNKRGSGIGLAVANEIVEMHGGRLDIISEQGVGTTVIITIPAIK
jgi:signal transduction histidine kinase